MSRQSVEPAATVDAWRLQALPTRQRACCCPAVPTVRILIPLDLGRGGVVDLLLCSHHYRTNIDPLKRIGAVAFDAGGALIMPRAWRLDVTAATVG